MGVFDITPLLLLKLMQSLIFPMMLMLELLAARHCCGLCTILCVSLRLFTKLSETTSGTSPESSMILVGWLLTVASICRVSVVWSMVVSKQLTGLSDCFTQFVGL